MKQLLFILLFFCSLTSATGQVTLTSPLTQYWPTMFTTEFEEINRSIWIENDEITISSETPEGKEIETLNVESFEQSENSLIFNCTTRTGNQPVKVIVPNPQGATAIDVFRISPKTGEEIQIRFHLN